MKKTFIKILSVVLCAVMVLGAAPLGGLVGLELPGLFDFKAEAATYSGTCGSNLTWSLNTDTGVLTITGTGAMTSHPWSSYSSDIKIVNIASGVTTIGDYAFYWCDSLTSVTIGNSVTTIGDEAFYSCDSLTSITIPDSIKIIGEEAFYHCTSLTSVTIGNSVTTIGERAFEVCNKLTSITIPDSVTTIGDRAFYNCKSLTSVTIGNSVTTIGNYAFYNCDSLTSVTIPDSVTSIGEYAFCNCDSLTSVTIPDSVTTTGDLAFSNCDNLINLSLDYANPAFTVDEYGVLFDKNKTKLILCPAKNDIEFYNIPNSVTKICACAFAGCKSIKDVNIPDSVTEIENGVFSDTYFSDRLNWENPEEFYVDNHLIHAIPSSDSYKIREGTITIAGNAFDNSKNLRNISTIIIPDSVVSIGDRALDGCVELTDISIGNGVKNIGTEAFNGCEKLKSVNGATNVEHIGDDAFNQNCPFINDQANYINDALYIGKQLYKVKTSVSGSYQIRNGTTEIGSEAFYGCRSLTSVTIPDSVTSIGNLAFFDCRTLENVTIPDGITTIGERAFSGCRRLASVTIPDGVMSIGDSAFYDCRNLTNVTIPDSVTVIGGGAFSDCDSLKSITIPNSVTTIGNDAFSACNSLTSVTIPDSVTTIGDYAFAYCESLADVYYGGTEEQWKKIAVNLHNDPLKNATIHFNSTGDNPTPDNPAPDNPDELTLVSTYPANGVTQLAYDDDLVLTFNMNVERNLSTLNEDGICIGIYDYKTDELVKSFDGLYVGYKHSGKTMTFEDAFRKLEPGKKYYIKIADDAIYSKATDKTLIYKGINNKDQWSFSYLNPTQKQGYSLDIYSSDRAITLSKGETQQVSVVLSLDGKPCKQDGISLSVANNGVAEISKIERESDRTVVTLKGLKNGTTTVTVTDNGSKTVKKFPVFVTDEASVYYFTDVEKYTEYNPMIVDDMFIDSFKHKKNNNGSYTVTFDVYNMGHSCGAVDVYDKNGNVVDSQIIELFDSDYPTDLFSHAEYAGKLVGNFALDIITGDLLYSVNNIKSELNSKQTSVSVTVPENGYYVITKNVTASNSCLLYNAFTLALDVAFESVGLIVDATDVAEELAQGVLSKYMDKYLKKICETFVEKGALLSAKNASVMAENLIIDVEYLFEAMGTTFIDAVIEAVPKVTTKITKEQAAKVFFGMSLKKCGKDIVDNILYGSIKAAKWVAICQNIYDYRNSNGAYVYASQNGNTKTSNGVIAKSDSDAQTVFHSILVTSGYYVDYIDAMHRPEADAELYSISMIKNGQKVQPSSPVTIYIPIPDGWGSEKIYIYHIKDNFEREELEGTIENGYIKFVTNGFSYFVIANDVVNFIDEFSIKPYSIATVNYGDTLVLQADLGEATLPEGWSIQWTVEGSGFNMTTEENGMKCKFTSVANGNATIKATLVNESGEAIHDAEDNEMSNEITLKSNASFWQKIVSFFKNLFRINRIIY